MSQLVKAKKAENIPVLSGRLVDYTVLIEGVAVVCSSEEHGVLEAAAGSGRCQHQTQDDGGAHPGVPDDVAAQSAGRPHLQHQVPAHQGADHTVHGGHGSYVTEVT